MSENLSLSYCSFKSDRINLWMLETDNILTGAVPTCFVLEKKGIDACFHEWFDEKNTELEM